MLLALLQDVLQSAPKTDFCKYQRHDACFDRYHVFFIVRRIGVTKPPVQLGVGKNTLV